MMRPLVRLALFSILAAALAGSVRSQTQRDASEQGQVPVDTQLTLDASSSVQKAGIRAVLLLECSKTRMKGTGFIVQGGGVVTAAHVACGCEATDISGTTPLNQTVRFKSLVLDTQRDLAALVPSERLEGGLELGSDSALPMAQQVNT